MSRIFTAPTLSILFSMKSSKTWIAPIFIPLYFMSVSSWEDGLIRTSKQETGTLLKRLIALLKQILKIHYSFGRTQTSTTHHNVCTTATKKKRPCNWNNALFSALWVLKKMACIIAWLLAVRTSKGKERQKGCCSSALLLPAPAASSGTATSSLTAAGPAGQQGELSHWLAVVRAVSSSKPTKPSNLSIFYHCCDRSTLLERFPPPYINFSGALRFFHLACSV